MKGFFARYRWAVAAVSGAVVVAVVVLLAVWPSGSGGRVLPPTRARAYAAWRACLVTGPAGLADSDTMAVWDGMEQASAKTSAKVSYLAALGNGSAATASTYVATAAGEQCDLVIAVGAPQVQGVAMVAHEFPRTRFAVVGGGAAGGNVTSISAGAGGNLSSAVALAVESAFDTPVPTGSAVSVLTPSPAPSASAS